MRHESAILSFSCAAINAQTASVQHLANAINVDEQGPAEDQILAMGALGDRLQRLRQVLAGLKGTLGSPVSGRLNHE